MKTGVLNIPAPVRMNPYPPRLQLQTLWMGVILTWKMTFWWYKCLSKVEFASKISVQNIPAPVRMNPCPPRFYLTNKIIQNRQMTKPVILIPLKSLTFKWGRTCLVYLLDPNHSDGPMELTSEMRNLLRNMIHQPKNEQLVVQQLNVCKSSEAESISLCMAFSFELLCNYKKGEFFKKFCNTRSHLYSCLKVSKNNFWLGQELKQC